MKVDIIRNGTLQWVQLDELQPGDMVPIDKKEQKLRKQGITLQEILQRRGQ